MTESKSEPTATPGVVIEDEDLTSLKGSWRDGPRSECERSILQRFVQMMSNPKDVKFWLLVFAMLCMSRANPEQCLHTVLQISSLIGL